MTREVTSWHSPRLERDISVARWGHYGAQLLATWIYQALIDGFDDYLERNRASSPDDGAARSRPAPAGQ